MGLLQKRSYCIFVKTSEVNLHDRLTSFRNVAWCMNTNCRKSELSQRLSYHSNSLSICSRCKKNVDTKVSARVLEGSDATSSSLDAGLTYVLKINGPSVSRVLKLVVLRGEGTSLSSKCSLSSAIWKRCVSDWGDIRCSTPTYSVQYSSPMVTANIARFVLI